MLRLSGKILKKSFSVKGENSEFSACIEKKGGCCVVRVQRCQGNVMGIASQVPSIVNPMGVSTSG
jgi:hypothetical protein